MLDMVAFLHIMTVAIPGKNNIGCLSMQITSISLFDESITETKKLYTYTYIHFYGMDTLFSKIYKNVTYIKRENVALVPNVRRIREIYYYYHILLL